MYNRIRPTLNGAVIEYLPMFHGLNVGRLEAELRLRAGPTLVLESADGLLTLSVSGPGVAASDSLAECGAWLEAARHAHLTRTDEPLRFALDGEMAFEVGPEQWMLHIGPVAVRLELVEVEQILNVAQLLLSTCMQEARPHRVSPEEYAQWDHPQYDMGQACKSSTCCAHGGSAGHNLLRPQR